MIFYLVTEGVSRNITNTMRLIWKKLESVLIFMDKLKCESDLTFMNGVSSILVFVNLNRKARSHSGLTTKLMGHKWIGG